MEIKKPLYLFIISFSLLACLRVINREFSVLNAATFTLVFLLSLSVSLYALTKLINEFNLESQYLKRILAVFFFYELIIIVRGLSFDYNSIKDLLQSDYTFWVYLIPLFIFFDKRLPTLVLLTDILYYLGVFFLIACILHPSFITKRSTAEIFIHPFAFGCGFLLLNARYLSKRKRAVALLALLVSVASFAFLARRNGIVSYTGFILAGLALNAKNLNSSKFFKILPAFAAIAIIILLNTDTLPESLTKRLNQRLTEDSRSYVVDNLFADMEDNIVFGKGMNGYYYSPMGGGGENEDGIEFSIQEYRNVIENGYLQLYLNGGIIYMVLFVLVLLPAALLGIFKSSSQFVQASGILIFLWLVDMFIFGLPRLTLQYVLVWICAGICYKKSLRDTPDEEISDAFLNYKDYEDTLVH